MELPIPDNRDGDPRKAGLELEFAGLELDEAAAIIRELYGGEVVKGNRYRYRIEGTRVGEFQVELDARLLQKMANTELIGDWAPELDEQSLKDSIGDVLDRLAKAVIPLEIVMPPVPAADLELFEELRKRLQRKKAEGTGSSWMHAFGMHINIEVPDLQAETLLNYLRAFFILYPWLLEELQINLSRRLSPFIDHFPDPYVQQVLDPGYTPDIGQLIDDYLAANPTRNRPLDMMPLWALIEPERVAEALGDEKNRPRPTFHYRLPNSRIDDPAWRFSDEWRYWLEVERLAGDDEMLRRLSRLYLFRKRSKLVSFREEWARTAAILLDLDQTTETDES